MTFIATARCPGSPIPRRILVATMHHVALGRSGARVLWLAVACLLLICGPKQATADHFRMGTVCWSREEVGLRFFLTTLQGEGELVRCSVN